MAEEGRRVSMTPIPVPVPFGAPQPPIQPTPSPLGQTPIAPPPAMEIPTATTETASAVPEVASKDVTMADAEASAPSPAPQHGASPAPNRVGTPARAVNGIQEQPSSSRAASAHPDPGFTIPAEAPPHGAPVRQYLNSKVTGALLEGMKLIAKEQPKDPLRVLGEYLLQRSKDVEGSA